MKLFMAALVALTAFAGCLNADTDPAGATNTDDLFSVEKRLSLASHPAYGYPTYGDYEGLLGDIPEAWMPPAANPLPEGSLSMEGLSLTEGVTSGAGIAVFGHYVFASGNGPGAVVDIMDPMNPVKVADLEADIRDADLVAHPDGRLTLVAASNGDIYLFDVTDPTMPADLGIIEVSSHNAAVVPGTPIVYNSGSAGGAGGLVPSNPGAWIGDGNGVTEIIDLTDPSNPVRLPDFENGYGCHDITFFIDADNDKYRAYCAGIEMSQIWDIADPLNPVVLVNIPVHHGVADAPSSSIPLVWFSHLATVNHDGTILIVGDETGGGLGPSCDAHVDAGAATASGPLGNLWFYDISDEMNPQLLSWFSPTSHLASMTYVEEAQGLGVPSGCTAHFGRVLEDRNVIPMAFYGAGVILVDFSDPMAPRIMDQYADVQNTWDVWEYQGYLFTGDLTTGVQTLKLV